LEALEKLRRFNEDTLIWIPLGYHGIPENEVDKLAKEGTN
jgi:hypothetical protein